MASVAKKVLMGCANYWFSPFQVGSHHIGRTFVKDGWQVAFISDPISPFHVLAGLSRELSERFALYRTGGIWLEKDCLWTYVPAALLTPHNKPLLRSTPVARFWHMCSFPRLKTMIRELKFDTVDLLYIDSMIFAFFLREIAHKTSILRIADRNVGFKRFSKPMQTLELEIAQSVDVVVYTASNLRDYVAAMRPRRMIHLPNGVNFEHFAFGSRSVPEEYSHIRRPIALYVGAMDVWFDYVLLSQAAARLPQVSFVLIGPNALAGRRLSGFSNIYLIGRKSYDVLPSYMHNADVGIIPFNVRDYPEIVHSINPLKLYEYMACGLPVVSTAWDELRHLQTPAILTETPQEFTDAIGHAIGIADRNILIEYAKKHDWRGRVALLESLCGDHNGAENLIC
jgi:glycosyltransferase involved in cell wall biosynthesis